MSIQLKKVTVTDVKSICEMYQDLSNDSLEFDLLKMTNMIKNLKDDDNIFIIKIMNNDIGVIQMHICHDLICNNRPFVVIENFYLKPHYRNHGYGKEALMRIIDKAKEQNAYHIMLLSSNHESRLKSHELYEYVGFESSAAKAFRMYID